MKIINTLSRDAYLELLARQEAMERESQPMRRLRHPEEDLQRQCVEWFRLQYPNDALLLFAVPNGGYRQKSEARIMMSQGVVPGVSDLILLESRGGWGSLCIELKTTDRGSRQSPRQKAWQEATEKAGNRYEVVRTFEEFTSIVADYMRLPAGAARRVVVKGAELQAKYVCVTGGRGKKKPVF